MKYLALLLLLSLSQFTLASDCKFPDETVEAKLKTELLLDLKKNYISCLPVSNLVVSIGDKVCTEDLDRYVVGAQFSCVDSGIIEDYFDTMHIFDKLSNTWKSHKL